MTFFLIQFFDKCKFKIEYLKMQIENDIRIINIKLHTIQLFIKLK
jgi:hypothetical protein